MPLTGDPDKDIPELIAAGHEREQAIAIALSEKRKKHGLIKYDPAHVASGPGGGQFASTANAAVASGQAAHEAAKASGDPKQVELASKASDAAKQAAASASNVKVNDYHTQALAYASRSMTAAQAAHAHAINAKFGEKHPGKAAASHLKNAIAHHAAVRRGKKH